MINRKAFLLIIVIYFPLVSSLFLSFANFEVVFFNYINIIFFAFVVFTKDKYQSNFSDDFFKIIVIFNIVFLLLTYLNFVVRGQGRLNALSRTYGINLAVLVIYYFKYETKDNIYSLFDKLFFLISVVFIIQFFVSTVESVGGISYGYISNSYDWNSSSDSKSMVDQKTFGLADIKDRLQTGYFFKALKIPFSMVYSGMLGQHNHWGTQLPFYNLIFLFQFYKQKKKKYYFILLILVFLAAIFNTSRFAIIAITITTSFFIYKYLKIPRIMKKSLIGLIIIIIAFLFGIILDNLLFYISMTDTFTGRLEVWNFLWPAIWDRGILAILIGSTQKEIFEITKLLMLPDFENLAYEIVFKNGLIGFFFFLFVLSKIWAVANNYSSVTKHFFRFLVINVILVSLWSNVFFRYSSYVFFTIILVRLSYEGLNRNDIME